MISMKKTSLYEIHKQNNAKIVEFAGWLMPVLYKGIREEHLGVRESAGLFDVSHMGELLIRGNEAFRFCQYITTNDLGKIEPGQAQYTLICYESGGVVDDVIIYKIDEREYLLCVNAANTEKDFRWVGSNSGNFDVNVTNVSSDYSQLALQGPNSPDILKGVLGSEIETIKKFRFKNIEWSGLDLIAARTGYTGEEGFEIFLPWSKGPELWKGLMEEGEKHGLVLSGLGARDTLRLEMGYSLYGFEIDKDINPFEAGLERYVKLDKGDFIGKESLESYGQKGMKRELIAFEMVERGIPRNGYPILSAGGIVGYVTSGTLSPSLGKSLGLGLVNSRDLIDDEIQVEIRNNKRKAKIVSLPFYKIKR